MNKSRCLRCNRRDPYLLDGLCQKCAEDACEEADLKAQRSSKDKARRLGRDKAHSQALQGSK